MSQPSPTAAIRSARTSSRARSARCHRQQDGRTRGLRRGGHDHLCDLSHQFRYRRADRPDGHRTTSAATPSAPGRSIRCVIRTARSAISQIGALQAAPDVTAGPPLRFTGITVPAGGTAALVYQAEVTAYAPPTADGVISNTVTVTGGALAGQTATEEITASQAARLEITKALSPRSSPKTDS